MFTVGINNSNFVRVSLDYCNITDIWQITFMSLKDHTEASVRKLLIHVVKLIKDGMVLVMVNV